MGKNVVDMTIRANMDLSNITSDISQIQNYLKKLKLSPDTKRSFDGLFDEATTELEKLQRRIDKGFKTKGDITGFEKASSSLEATFKKIENKIFKLSNLSDKELFKLDPKLKGDIEAIEKKFANIGENFPKNISNGLKKISEHANNLITDSQKKAGKEIVSKVANKDYAGALKQAQQKLRQQQLVYDNNIHVQNPESNVSKQIALYKKIIAILQVATNYQDQFNNKTKYLETEKAERYRQTIEMIQDALQGAQAETVNASKGFKQISNSIRSAGEETVNFNSELDSIKQRVAYFFSLTNSVMLFRRILQDTIQTTKELDAAMTETAVVTDFSVSDMWKELPRYTKLAKELGTTIKGVYETMTLYYQQGLKTEEVVEVGTETLKMARIAGLDYAKATDFMTAALRGFNMEVNETNAQRVNDVYSELAAITAADTQEIATAMTKTASIASSANMEFETTAAFLSQIIETTRESAETAGTAMKTVIARFTELKKDPAEIGEVDGEIVDANKIETALRTIDVELRDTSGQFRELDDVFLDISAKWAGLDTNTQRYIATMAAGSRQQSRFIAMMSDYSRTMELVNAANNSAGASQKQFDKTLESLEAKLNQLKDAWDQFTMGIANDTLIKAGVDALTGFVNILNKITEDLPGPLKGIGNLLLLFGGFKAGGKILNAFSASVLKDLTALANGTAKTGEKVGDSFFKALKKEFSSNKTSNLFKSPLKDIENAFKEINELEVVATKELIDKSDIKSAEKLSNIFLKRIEIEQNLEKIQNDYNTLQNLGYNKAVSNLIINKGISLEEVKQLAFKKAQNKEDEKELKTLQRKIILKKLLTGYNAEELGDKLKNYAENAQKEGGIIKKNTTAKLAQWASTKLLAGGYKALIISLGQFVLIAGAVVSAIALISHAIETNEEKEKRLQKAIERTGESMEESKTAIEELKTSMEDLGNLDTELDGLVKGTDAWKEKLIEVNDKVLEIMNKYPQLAQYLSEDVDGKLSISSEGWDEVLLGQKKKLNAATLANTISTQQKNQFDTIKKAKEEIKKSDLTEGAATSVETMQLAKRFAKAGKFLTNDEEANAKVLKNTRGLDDDLKAILEKDNGIAEFNKIVGIMKSSNLQLEKSNEALVSHFVNQNQIISGSKYSEGITKLISSKLETDEYGNISSEVVEALNKNYGRFGSDGQRSDMNKSKIWEEYAKYARKTYDEVKEEAKDDANITYSMALELASQDAAEEMSKSAELLVKGLNKIGVTFLKTDKQLSNSFKALFTDTLTQQDIDNLKTNQPQFSELPQEIKEYFDNNSFEYQKFINEQIKLAEEQLASAGEVLANLPADKLDTSKISTGAMKGLALELQEVFYKSGEEGVKAITESYNAIVGSLDKEQAEKFTAALNGIDWSSVTNINDLKNTLYDMGVYIDDSKLKDLSDDIIEFNKATQAVSLDQLISQLESSQSLIEEISDRERGERSFTKEEKDKLTNAGISEDLFVGYGDSWRYVGSSLNDLIIALEKNTQAIIGDSTEQLKQKLGLAQASTRIQNEGKYDLANYGVLSVSNKQELLGNFIKESGLQTIAGYDAEALGNLTNTNILLDTYQKNVLNQILETIANSIGTEDSVSAELESYKKQSGIAAYSGKTTTETVAAATGSDPIESEKATNALLHRAAAYDTLDDEIREYNEAIEAEDKELANNIKKEIGAKVAIEERAEALDDLDDKVEDHIKGLKKTNKGTDEYKEGLADLIEDLNFAFGTDLTSEFFEGKEGAKNLTLLEKALEGSQTAWESLIINMQKAQVENDNFATTYGLNADYISNITTALDGLDYDINGHADISQVVAALYTAGATTEDVASKLEALGLTNIEFSVDKEDFTLPDGSIIQVPKKVTATNVNIPAARRASSFGSGGPASGTKTGDEGGGGGGNEWENPYDSFYNSAAALNKLLEKRNKLEQEYDEILQDEDSDIQDFVDNYEDRIKNYGEEIALQNQIITNRKKEQQDILNKNSDLKKYAWIDEEGKVQIDIKKIDKVTDEDLGQRIEDYISSLETNTEEITKAEEAINEAEKAAEDLADEYQQTTADFEKDLYDAIVYQREQEIEQMEGIADSLDNSAQNLISAIQEEINERRQERDNKKTEEDIADKERRLAYLQQDTSGAYDQEILQLQKELGEQKEDYTDTLIDQKISEIEKQNDEAAKQREKQIQIAQYQLENDKNNGEIAKQVRDLMNGTTGVGKGNWNAIMDLLMAKDGFKGLTSTEQEIWKDGVHKNFKSALAFLQSGGKENLATLLKEGRKQAVNNIYNYYGNQSETKKSGSDGTSNKQKKVVTPPKTPKYIAADAVPDHGIKQSEYSSRGGIVATVSSERGYGEYVRQKVKQEKIDGKPYYKFDGQYYDEMPLSSAKNEKGGFNVILKRGLPIFKKYKTGGLADYTGPAWLDGTKSKPELVLNQRDTQNFLQLKDILSSFMKNKTSITNNNNNKTGDTIYEVSISVDKISSDYDVEEMASTIKRMISTDALHRNSNFVGRRI